MDKKVCIITGANAGIGKQAAIQLASVGFHVVIACRNENRAAEALRDVVLQSDGGSAEAMRCDLSSRASLYAFAEEAMRKFLCIDVLIHNAAIFNITQKQPEFTEDGVETVWATNHIGPVLLTKLLLPNIKNSEEGRILTVSSKGLLAKPGLRVDLRDPEYKNRKYSVSSAYYQSKRAQEMYTLWLADTLRGTSVCANCIRVTAVRVDLDRHPGLSAFARRVYQLKSKMALTPQQMARTYAYLASSAEVSGVSGRCFDEKNRTVAQNRYTTDRDQIAALMKLTETYLKQE